MPRKKKEPIRIMKVPKNATMQQIYAQARRAFANEDLEEIFDIDYSDTIAADTVVAQMEAIQTKEDAARKKKRKKK